MSIIIALILYPGLLLAIVLGGVFMWFTSGGAVALVPGVAPLRNAEGRAALAGLLLAVAGLVLLPWPLHPAGSWGPVGNLAAIFAAFEGAWLVPAVPLALRPEARLARAASREMQLAAAGRAVCWLVIGGGLLLGPGRAFGGLPGSTLLVLGGLAALPAAASVGPFAPERSLGVDGPASGLDESTTGLLRWTAAVRGAALLAAVILAALRPLGLAPVPALGLAAALFLVAVALLRPVSLNLPRLTLPGGLRWCWARALPLALAGVIYLAAVTA
jgi:hypothetical protein